MAAKPLDIGDLSFARKGDAQEHFRQILRRHDPGVALSEPDATQVYWLLERHPEAAVKIGAGVKEFSTRSAMFDTRCFEIRRIDGSTTDFSVKPCLDGKAPSAFAETLRAMRTEVFEDIKQIDLTGLFWTKLCEKVSLERSFGHAEEEVQGGADRGAAAPD